MAPIRDSKFCMRTAGRTAGRVGENNATGSPNSSAETKIILVELVSWGRVWQKGWR